MEVVIKDQAIPLTANEQPMSQLRRLTCLAFDDHLGVRLKKGSQGNLVELPRQYCSGFPEQL